MAPVHLDIGVLLELLLQQSLQLALRKDHREWVLRRQFREVDFRSPPGSIEKADPLDASAQRQHVLQEANPPQQAQRARMQSAGMSVGGRAALLVDDSYFDPVFRE